MTRVSISDTDLQGLKSGIYNANSVSQHLRARMEDLERKSGSLQAEIFQLQQELAEIKERVQ